MRPVRFRQWLLITASIILTLLSANFAGAVDTLYSESMPPFEAAAAKADPNNRRFVFLSDSSGNDGKLKEMLEAAVKLKPLFILHGGDVSRAGGAEELTSFYNIAASVKGLPPLFVIRGNHEAAPDVFEHILGPRNFVLDSPRLGLRLVAINNGDYTINTETMNFLTGKLDGARPYQFVAMHIPPATKRWTRHAMSEKKRELLALLAERKVRLALFGHNHLFDKDEYSGVPLITSGGAGSQLAWFGYSGEPVYHMVVVEVKKGKVSYKVERFATTLVPIE